MKESLFETNSANFVATIALKLNYMEKKMLKELNTEQVAKFYSDVYKACEKFESEILKISTKGEDSVI